MSEVMRGPNIIPLRFCGDWRRQGKRPKGNGAQSLTGKAVLKDFHEAQWIKEPGTGHTRQRVMEAASKLKPPMYDG